MLKIKLPNKLSELITVAVEDLEKVEKNPQYKIDMGEWHKADDENKTTCSVCFAGAVISQRSNALPGAELDPYCFPEDDKRKLWALNEIREGNLREALHDLDVDTEKVEKVCSSLGLDGFDYETDRLEVVEYEDNPKLFKEQMITIAGILAAEELMITVVALCFIGASILAGYLGYVLGCKMTDMHHATIAAFIMRKQELYPVAWLYGVMLKGTMKNDRANHVLLKTMSFLKNKELIKIQDEILRNMKKDPGVNKILTDSHARFGTKSGEFNGSANH